VEIGEGKIDYYQTFEQVMLEDAASYYSRLASEMLCYKSYTDYIQKVVVVVFFFFFFFYSLKGNSLKNSSIQYKLWAYFLSMIQVAWFLIQERERAGCYLQQASLEKLLEVFLFVLVMFYHH
jgi:hypothetical protein